MPYSNVRVEPPKIGETFRVKSMATPSQALKDFFKEGVESRREVSDRVMTRIKAYSRPQTQELVAVKTVVGTKIPWQKCRESSSLSSGTKFYETVTQSVE